MQRALFPEGLELQAEALEALGELDLARGRACLERSRAVALEVGDVETVERALAWLERVLADAPRDGEAVARAFLALPGELPGAAARFVEEVLARFGLRSTRDTFVDRAGSLPRVVLPLALGQRSGLRHPLAELARREPQRADLCGWLAEACLRDERPEEANAALVRGLLLDAAALDFFRLRTAPLDALGTLLDELTATEPAARARELVLVHAWLRGLLTIPPGNGWLEEGELARLRARCARPGDPATRARAFALLLFQDRSRRPVEVDENEREALRGLEPELFRSFMAVLDSRADRR